MSNLEGELSGEAASLPAGWDAHKAAAAAEIAALTLNDPACNTNLYNSAVRNALYTQGAVAAYTEYASNTADVGAVQPYITGVDATIAQNISDYADLVTPPPPVPPNPVPPNPVPPNPVPPNPVPPGTDIEVEWQAVAAAMYYYNVQNGEGMVIPSGGTTAQRIAIGRAALVSNKHYLLTRNINWKGTADVMQLIHDFGGADSRPWGGTNGVPNNGTPLFPTTIDFWNTGKYLMDSTLLIYGAQYRTYNLHGAETHPKPPIYVGLIRVDGMTSIQATYVTGQNFMTCNVPYDLTPRRTSGPYVDNTNSFVNARIANQDGDQMATSPTDNHAGIPNPTTVVSTVTNLAGTAIIRLNLSATVTQSHTNQNLYVNDRSPHVFGTGFTSALIGRQFTADFYSQSLPTGPSAKIVSITASNQLELDQGANLDATGHAWAISGGNELAVRNRNHWKVERCKNLRITGGTIRGAYPPIYPYPPGAGGSTSAWGGTTPRNDSYLEAQSGIEVLGGGPGLVFDNLNIVDVWGDFVRLSGSISGSSVDQLDGCEIHHIYGTRAGRQGMSPVNCINVYVHDCILKGSGRSGFDLEPYTATSTIHNVTIENCDIYWHGLNTFASVGKGSGNTGTIYLLNNREHSKEFGGQTAGGLWVVIGNSTTDTRAFSTGRGAPMWFDYAHGVTLQNNNQPVKSGTGMVLGIGYQMSGTFTVSGNNGFLANGGGLPVRPAGGYYQARFSRNVKSNPQTGYVYYPTP